LFYPQLSLIRHIAGIGSAGEDVELLST